MENHIQSEIIAMAWDDRTSFDVIKKLHGLSEPEVKALMKRNLKPSSYRLWRRRVYGRTAKHHRTKIKSPIWSKSQTLSRNIVLRDNIFKDSTTRNKE